MTKLKEISNKLLRLKFLRFFISGFTAFLVDTVTLALATFLLFQGQNVMLLNSISIPKLISSTVGLFTNFILNRKWVFKINTSETVKKQAIKFILFSVANVLFASIIYNIYLGIVITIVETIHLDLNGLNNTVLLLANIMTEGTKMVVSYFGYKYIVFK